MTHLDEVAKTIVVRLHENGFEDDGGIRQVLNLIEEAGEMTGAFRRWVGWARRSGTQEEFEAELADVVITAYVTAAELNWRIDVTPLKFLYRTGAPEFEWPGVLNVVTMVNAFTAQWLDSGEDDGHANKLDALQQVVYSCYHLAEVLGFDLDAAIDAKLAIVFTRGWREVSTT